MKITKYGHCCLLIEVEGLRILTDPGDYSEDRQNKVQNVDVILITHEHGDHLHIPSLKIVIQNNPQAKVITNSSVGKLLDNEQIKYSLLEDGQNLTEKEVLFEAFGSSHHLIYEGVEAPMNTGYFIDNKLFYPGDALTNPGKPVEILALPVLAPWLKPTEAIDYAKELKPRVCFPVHDAFLKITDGFYNLPNRLLGAVSIKFVPLEIEQETEFE